MSLSKLLWPLTLFTLITISPAIPLKALRITPQDRGDRPYTIAVNVDLVVFNVTVTDRKGRPVSGLKVGDFQVSEDNRLQDITLFSSQDTPANVGLIIDNSSSMRSKSLEVNNAALAFVTSSNPEDELFVVKFDEKAFLCLPPSIAFTDNVDEIRSALLRSAPDGLTALYDALAMGIEHLKAGTRDRKALVVLSDGGDNASRLPLNEVLEMARRSSATIYTIGIYDETDLDRNPRVLEKIANLTGGRAYFPDSLSDLGQVWRDIATGLRSQYTIGYRSTNKTRDGAFREVKITVGRNGSKNLKVITRDGYFAPAGSIS